ncbi:hypothetical protein [Paenibacillus alkalitolerans]|uniref:hypothetical protein n=1 Tax=Paenibacillus alkalitolerans TaxID=2799335 RepID=UPI0018F39166|nr:hypothetical protein [Paenibacillus alkalitolerans]
MDYDHNHNEIDCAVNRDEIRSTLQQSFEVETEMLRTYTILAERVHNDDELKIRLQNFAQGNAKRSRELMHELRKYDE